MSTNPPTPIAPIRLETLYDFACRVDAAEYDFRTALLSALIASDERRKETAALRQDLKSLIEQQRDHE